MTNTEETLQPNTEALALRRKKKAKRVTYVTLIHLALIVTSLLFVFPLIWMVSVSLQSEEEMRLANGFWDMLVPNEWLWSNYPEVFKAIPFMRYFKNSAIVTSLTVLGTVVSASLVSYAFSKLRWPGRNVVYTVMLATMILPGFILMIPTYKMYSKMGFVDTWVPLILPAFLGGGAGNIILIQQFFMSIPKEMSEAAMIDGASEWKLFIRIVLPMSLPVMASIGLFTMVGQWNSWFDAFLYVRNNSNLWPLQYYIQISFNNLNQINQGNLDALEGIMNIGTLDDMTMKMALTVIGSVPILIVYPFFQKYFTKGVYVGSVKG